MKVKKSEDEREAIERIFRAISGGNDKVDSKQAMICFSEIIPSFLFRVKEPRKGFWNVRTQRLPKTPQRKSIWVNSSSSPKSTDTLADVFVGIPKDINMETAESPLRASVTMRKKAADVFRRSTAAVDCEILQDMTADLAIGMMALGSKEEEFEVPARGTLKQLIAYALLKQNPDFAKYIILSHRRWTEETALIDTLIDMYNTPALRQRILWFLLCWCNNYYPVLLDSQKVSTLLESFMEKTMRTEEPDNYESLKRAIASTYQTSTNINDYPEIESAARRSWVSVEVQTNLKRPFNNTKAFRHLSLFNFHPVEFARQLTLLDYRLMRAVKVADLVTSPQNSALIDICNFNANVDKWIQNQLDIRENQPKKIH